MSGRSRNKIPSREIRGACEPCVHAQSPARQTPDDESTGVVMGRGLLLALFLGGCAMAATQQQIDSNNGLLSACIDRNAASLDDYKSEAITTAYGILAACAN